jgi:hypothetical protein
LSSCRPKPPQGGGEDGAAADEPGAVSDGDQGAEVVAGEPGTGPAGGGPDAGGVDWKLGSAVGGLPCGGVSAVPGVEGGGAVEDVEAAVVVELTPAGGSGTAVGAAVVVVSGTAEAVVVATVVVVAVVEAMVLAPAVVVAFAVLAAGVSSAAEGTGDASVTSGSA